MYGQCLFLYVNWCVDVYFHFHFSSSPDRDDTAAAAAPSDEVIDVHACIYKYIIRVRMYGFVCAQLVSIIHTKNKVYKTHLQKKKK